MKHKFTIVVATATAGLLCTAAAALALNLYTPDQGGFVGKGDVQTALLMNNEQIQTAVKDNKLAFSYDSSVEYSAPCFKIVGGTRQTDTKYKTFTETFTVAGTVVYDARRKNQVNGFDLDPVTGTSSTTAPTHDDICASSVSENDWQPDLDPEKGGVTTGASSGGGLYVSYNGRTRVLIPSSL